MASGPSWTFSQDCQCPAAIAYHLLPDIGVRHFSTGAGQEGGDAAQ